VKRNGRAVIAPLLLFLVLGAAAPAHAQLNVTLNGALGDLDGDGDGGANEAAMAQAVVACWAARIVTNRPFTLTIAGGSLSGGTLGQGAVTAVDGAGVPTAGALTMDNDGSTPWFVDATPLNSSEFTAPDTQSQWRLLNGPAGFDLFRSLSHEAGHALGWLCGGPCGNTNPNFDGMMNPAPGSFVAGPTCTAPFPLAGQPALAGCVHLQSGAAYDVSLRGDGLGGSGSSVVNELSHPGVTGDMMIGFAAQGVRETQTISDVAMFAFAHGDAVNLPPTVNAGADVVSECNAVGGSTVTLDGSLSTDPEGAGSLVFAWSCPGVALAGGNTSAPSGFFALDQTVACDLNLTDTAACPADRDTVDVTVQDTTAPTINCPAGIVVECSAAGGTPATDPAIVAFLAGAAASDVCDAALPIANDAPAFFDLGTTDVEFSTADDSSNGVSCSAPVQVADTTPPVINGASATPDVLWPPNHRMRAISLDVSVEDVCDPTLDCEITGVTANEPVDGRGDGTTAPDWVLTGPLTLELRAERAGPGSGRLYTIEVACTDGSGNSSSTTVNVSVPHNTSAN
jgi:hypothetical protein